MTKKLPKPRREVKEPLLTDLQCRVILKGLRQFGYPDLTLDKVRITSEQIHTNTDKETDVIAVLMRLQISEWNKSV